MEAALHRWYWYLWLFNAQNKCTKTWYNSSAKRKRTCRELYPFLQLVIEASVIAPDTFFFSWLSILAPTFSTTQFINFPSVENLIFFVSSQTSKEDRDSNHESIPKDDIGFSRLKDLPKATKLVFSSLPFLFVTVGACLESFLVAVTGAFLPKVIQTQFYQPPARAALLYGLVVVPSAFCGNMLGKSTVDSITCYWYGKGWRGSDAVNRVPDAPHLFANPARCLDDGLHYRALTCAPNCLICDLLTFFNFYRINLLHF